MPGIDKSKVQRWCVTFDGVTVRRWQLRLMRDQNPPRFHSTTGARRISPASMRRAQGVNVARAMGVA